MKIVIHGTKGGWQVLFPAMAPAGFAVSDVRPITSREEPIGQSAYSIAFENGGCVFTKYKIIRDMQRSMATGNIAVSLFVEADKKLDGVYIKELLDKIMLLCCPEKKIVDFIPQNEINNVLNTYQTLLKLAADIEYFTSQKGESAYLYYNSDGNLLQYFDNFDQSAFAKYKQVYLIDTSLDKKPESPLNALRHDVNANLTNDSRIDISPKYTLFKYTQLEKLKVDIKIDGYSLTKNYIRSKNVLMLDYHQDYRKPQHFSGTWNELKNKDCIEVDDTNKTVTIKPIVLQDDKKSVTITVTDSSNNQIPNAQIFCQNPNGKHKEGNKLEFIGDEIGEQWKITVSKDGYEPKSEKIVPNDISNKNFILRKQITVTVKAYNNSKKLSDFEIAVYNSRTRKYEGKYKDEQVSFTGNAINEFWFFEITKDGYYSKRSEAFYPAKCNHIEVDMEESRPGISNNKTLKQQPPSYIFSFDPGEYGKPFDSPSYTDYQLPDYDDNDKIKHKYGLSPKSKTYKYRFTEWKQEQSDNQFVFVAQYKETHFLRYAFIAGFSLIAIIVLLSLWNPFGDKSTTPKINPATEQDIERYITYVQEIELNKDSLKLFKESMQESINKFGKKPWWWDDRLLIYLGGEPSSVAILKYKDAIQKLDSAIQIRKAIIDRNLNCLKNYRYYEAQNGFYEAINSISSDSILKTIQGIENMPLSTIADSINTRMQQPEQPQEKQPEQIPSNQSEPQREQFKPEQPKKESVKPQVERPKTESNTNSHTHNAENQQLLEEVRKCINGNDFKKSYIQELIKKMEQVNYENKDEYKALKDCKQFRTLLTRTRNSDGLTQLFNSPSSTDISKKTKWYKFLGTVVNSQEKSKNVEKLNKIRDLGTKSIDKIKEEYEINN
jgi:hypothetical protein